MEKLTRRNVLRSSAVVTALAVGGVAGQLATCSSTGIVINPAVLTAIQSAVATACNFIPTVEINCGLSRGVVSGSGWRRHDLRHRAAIDPLRCSALRCQLRLPPANSQLSTTALPFTATLSARTESWCT